MPPETSDKDHSEFLRYRLARAEGFRTILFVCTGNAVRSQIAEGIATHFFAGKWVAFSAGTMPMEIHQDVITVMKEIGIDLSAKRPKHVELFKDCAFDKVVILCSDAGMRCPDFPYAGEKDQMNFEDPLSSVLSGGICLSYRSRLRSLRDDIRKAVTAYLRALS